MESIILTTKPLRYHTSFQTQGLPLNTKFIFSSFVGVKIVKRGKGPGKLRPLVDQLELIGGFWLSYQVAFVWAMCFLKYTWFCLFLKKFILKRVLFLPGIVGLINHRLNLLIPSYKKLKVPRVKYR